MEGERGMPVDLIAVALGLVGFALPYGLARATRAGERRPGWAWAAVAATAVAWVGYVVRVRGLPTGESAVAARVQWVLVGAVLALLAAHGGRALWQGAGRGTPDLDRTDRWLVGLTVLALALRVAYPHAVMHAELFGPRLLSLYFGFPEVSAYRESYGQVSFFVLGALSHLARSVSTITLSNAVFSALTVPVAAQLVRRWTRQPAAALATAAFLAVHPAFLRVGTSEDAHVLSVLLFAGALLAFDQALDEPVDGTRLAIGTLLLALMAWSRQSLVPLVFVPYLALVERRGWRALARPAVVASIVTVGSAALAQVLRNALHEHNHFVYYMLSSLAMVPSRFLAEPHPLVDWAISPLPVPLLLAIGLWCARRTSAVWVAPALGLLVVSILSAPMAVFGPGVQLTFRLPVLFLAVLLAGVGAGATWQALEPRGRGLRLGLTAAAGVLLVACAGVGAWRLARPDPQTQELDFLEEALPLLPPHTTIVAPFGPDLFGPDDNPDPRPSWNFPHFLLKTETACDVKSLADYLAAPPPETGAVVFYRGLACHALSLSEGNPAFRAAMAQVTTTGDPAALPGLFTAMFDVGSVEAQPDPSLVRTLRSPCYEGLAAGPPLGPGFTRVVTKPWPSFTPNLFYPEDRMEIGFFSIRP